MNRPGGWVVVGGASQSASNAGPARNRAAGAASGLVVDRQPALAWVLGRRPTAAAAARVASLAWPGTWRRDTIWNLDFRASHVLGTLRS